MIIATNVCNIKLVPIEVFLLLIVNPLDVEKNAPHPLIIDSDGNTTLWIKLTILESDSSDTQKKQVSSAQCQVF